MLDGGVKCIKTVIMSKFDECSNEYNQNKEFLNYYEEGILLRDFQINLEM